MVVSGDHFWIEAYHPTAQQFGKKPEKSQKTKEWGQDNGHPEIVTVEQRWDHDSWFKSEQIKLGLTRSDMIEWTERSHNGLPQQPLPSYLVKQQVEGRYKLSSRRGDSKPLREIPGIRAELKRNPGTSGFLAARKRKGEDEQNIKQKHLAR